MDSSPNLTLPYIIAAQAQKHVTHNEAIRSLDAIVQLMVLDKDLASPPGSPSNGDRYIVAASPTGAWTGQTGNVAAWQDGIWAFYPPRAGWVAWVDDEGKIYVYDGSAWGEITVAVGTGVALWGINATADTTNRLALKSAASLFDNVGAGHQHKINKAAAGDTASLLFQTGYSGRAEFGTTGDDDFHVKVSPDGSTWYEALVVDKSTGAARFPTTTYLDLPAASAPATPASGKVRLYAKTDKSLYQKDDAGLESGLAGGGSGGGAAMFPNGHASLASGVPYPTSDLTAQGTIYYPQVPIPIWDGSQFNMKTPAGELSLPLDSNSGHTNYHQSGKNYDVFAIDDSGTIRKGSGPKWNDGAGAGSDTARGTGAASTELEFKNGILTNKNSIVIRYGSSSGDTVTVAANKATYLYSFRATADGQATDSAAKRLLWNMYNRRMRAGQTPTAANHTYQSATVRQWNADSTMKVEFLVGWQEDWLFATIDAAMNSANYGNGKYGFGLDTTTAFSAGTAYTDGGYNIWFGLGTNYAVLAPLGYHYLALNEVSQATYVVNFGNPSSGGPATVFLYN